MLKVADELAQEYIQAYRSMVAIITTAILVHSLVAISSMYKVDISYCLALAVALESPAVHRLPVESCSLLIVKLACVNRLSTNITKNGRTQECFRWSVSTYESDHVSSNSNTGILRPASRADVWLKSTHPPQYAARHAAGLEVSDVHDQVASLAPAHAGIAARRRGQRAVALGVDRRAVRDSGDYTRTRHLAGRHNPHR